MAIPVLLIAAGAGLALSAFGRVRAARQLQHKRQTLKNLSASVAQVSGRHLESLPAPVKKYMSLALGDDPASWEIRRAILQQSGSLRTSTRTDRWMPFTAVHHVSGTRPGFVWTAAIKPAPLLSIQVTDSYLQGCGSGTVHLLSAIRLASTADCMEMNSGALHRYLAEAVWCPTALLPGPFLTWSAIDERRALARLTDGENTVELEFRFRDDGMVAGIYSPARWGSFDGRFRQEPWEGHFGDYIEVQGMRVPSSGEVGWYDGGQWKCVWRGRILKAGYEMASAHG